ncbi:YggT family protein [Agromyces sp. M3QZ16-3]|uniref:YggT family protein n=1 Tax=Agromyces sp. M3QZ16-3 TaxID=3447585 RepID=UPI003F692028
MSRTDAAETEWKPPWYLRLLKIATWILYIWVLIGVIALSLRVFLLLFAANPDAGFAAFVYRVSDAYLHPFRDIFPTRDLSDGGYLDVSALFAIIIYSLIAGGIGAGVAAIGRRIERSERQHRDEMDRMARAEQARRMQGVGTTPSGAQAIVGGYPAGQVPTGGAGYPPRPGAGATPGTAPGAPPNGPATPPGSTPPY